MNTPNPDAATRVVRALFAVTLGAVGLGTHGAAAAFEIKPDARLHVDYADHDADVEPLDDGWIARRATIGLKGKFNDDWSFEASYELTSKGDIRPRDGEFKDVALTYDGWRAGEITAIAGVSGNGQQALADVLCGMQATDSGSVRVLETSMAASPRAFMSSRAMPYSA